MFDLARDMGPPPTGVNLIEQRARRIVKPWRRGLLRLEMIAVEARPSLQWIMVPGAAREILIHVKIAMAQHVEPGPLLVADDYRQRILELLAEPHVEHAGVERAAPHTDVEPTRTRERTSDGRGQNEARGRGEHAGIVTAEWGRPAGLPRLRRFAECNLEPVARAEFALEKVADHREAGAEARFSVFAFEVMTARAAQVHRF